MPALPRIALLALPVLAAALGCAPPPPAPASAPPRGLAPLASASPAPARPGFAETEARVAREITAAALAARTRFLADDVTEGRAPGSRGSDIAMRYIASELESFGLLGGAADGSFFQKVPLVGITAKASAKIPFRAKGGTVALEPGKDIVVMSGVQEERVRLPATDLVFVGYGIEAPEYAWSDYKDVDVKGKVVVVMNNDPESDPALFGGKTRLWFGRWDYKYLQAARKGAAGCIILHTTPSAGYPWQVVVTSNHRERFELPEDRKEPRMLAKMWATEGALREVFAAGGADLDALVRSAESRDFRPTTLPIQTELSFTNTLRAFESANVIATLPGGDAKDEAVVFTAHHDHLGVGAPKPSADAIYNGAVDNASGVASLLTMARAYAAAEARPRRSLVFVAVTAEEAGLLGSEHYARHPTFPPGRIAANINMDSMNVFGRTSDVGFIGRGRSSLDAVVEVVAALQGRSVHGDAFPERGGFYRSDQFNFAKMGVPALYASGGPTYVGRPAGWGEQQRNHFTATHYHQPSDEFDPTWDWSGAVEDAQLLAIVGLRVANAPAMPTWKPGDEFANVPRPR
jgi:Zn-dependent M28 family amino/carboxypeptidase